MRLSPLSAASSALALVAMLGSCHAFAPPSLSAATNAATAVNAASPATATSSPLQDFDQYKESRLPWYEQGYQTWEWNSHKINYLELGDPSKPALLLIHGFGASAYHFRHNIPELARDYHVYAFDLLGFGLSDKPVQDYAAEVWRDQALDFIEQIIQRPIIVAGNSLGGFTALYASAEASNRDQDLIKGCVLLNAAGRFRDPTAPPETTEKNAFIEKIQETIKRFVINASFIYTKRPERIEQVLKTVYPINDENVDPELVESIRFPSLDPNAAEVFYRVITKNGSGPSVYVDDLLNRLDDKPLLLAWGESDPWIRPQAADKIQALYPASRRVSIDAGHCPHDEAPEAVNAAIRDFVNEIHGL